MRIAKKQKTWLWILGVVGGVVLVGGVTFGVMWLCSDEKKIADNGGGGENTVNVIPEPTVMSVGGKMLMTGNIFWGRKINTVSRESELGVEYPFSGLHTLEREKYTDWIGGLECPVTDMEPNKYEEETLLKFNCHPDYLAEFAKWFSVVSLANNHTDNQGVDGWAETKERLAGVGVQYFGHYDYRDTGEVCAVVAVNAWQEMSDRTRRITQLPMAMCGWNGVFGIPTEASLSMIREYAEVMPVIAMPHMGAEYKAESDAIRERTYRKMIDYGAEMVIGDHAHWVQNAEAYEGKLIVYSMGNFMFDQTWDAEVRRSAAIAAEFAVSGAEGWEKIALQCAEGGLSVCKGLAEEAGLSKYSATWKFDAVGTDTINLVTQKASDEVTKGILERLKWETVKAELANG